MLGTGLSANVFSGIFLADRNSVAPATKLRTFDSAFRANGTGVEGNEKPTKAQTAKTKNIPPKENRVYFDILVKGDHVKRAKLDISQASRG